LRKTTDKMCFRKVNVGSYLVNLTFKIEGV